MYDLIKKRIKETMEITGYRSVRAFSLKIGIPQTSLNQALISDRSPSVLMLYKICETFPSISADWLLMGKGNAGQGCVISDSKIAYKGNIQQNNGQVQNPVMNANDQQLDGVIKERDFYKSQVELLQQQNSTLQKTNDTLLSIIQTKL